MPLTPADIAALSRLLDDAGDDLQAWRRAADVPGLPAGLAHLAQPLRAMQATPTGDLVGELPALPGTGPGDACAGQCVGPYRLLQRIGAGGMGTVWLAARDDGLYDRQVALKLPHAAWGDRLAQRMQRERRAAARLSHPHIAPLYDAGVDDHGRPYIAMAYIEGLAIDTWCHGRQLDVHATLRLFVQVVDAVAHAHERQVVHRDIKPANILVDAAGTAHLLDFGIAKLMDDSAPLPLLTQETTRVMSVAYAAPEQFLGQPVTPATDIYALGVTLFELLTGQRPHADAAGAASPACTAQAAPAASSTVRDPRLRRALRGDVDAILARSLAMLPGRRYTSAQALADDLRSHLQGRPVRARPDSRAYRWARHAARHRRGLGLACAFGLLCAGAGWALVAQVQRTAEQADTARIAQAFAADMLQLNARGMAGTPPGAASGPGLLLERAVTLIETRSAHRPALQADLYGAVARVYVDIGAGRLAVELARRQLDTLQRIEAPAEARCRALLLLARAWTVARRYAEAEAHARGAVALAPLDTPAGLEAQAVLAGLLMPNGRHAEAATLLDAADAAWRHRGDVPALPHALLLDARGRLLEIRNDYTGALALWQRAITLALAVEGEGSALANRIRHRMALEDLSRNRPAEARRAFQQAIGSQEAAGDAGRVQAARAAATYAALGYRMGHLPYDEARSLAEHARSTVLALGASLPEDLMAQIETAQGWMALRHGDLPTARRLLERAVPVVQRHTDGLIDRRGLATYLAVLAMVSGDHGGAEPLLRQRMELRVQSGDGQSPPAATDWQWLSHNRLMAGDLEGAWRVLEQAPAFQPLEGDRHAGGAAYAHVLPEQRTRILLERGDTQAALEALPAAYGLPPLEDRSEPMFTPYALRGEVLCAAGQAAQGLPYLHDSISAMATALSPAEPGLARVRAVAGLCALSLGRTAQARAWARQSRAAFNAQPQVSPWFKTPLRQLESRLQQRGAELARRAPQPAETTRVRHQPL